MKIIEIEHCESLKPSLNFNNYNIEIKLKAQVDGTEDFKKTKNYLQDEAREYLTEVIQQSLPVFLEICKQIEEAKIKK